MAKSKKSNRRREAAARAAPRQTAVTDKAPSQNLSDNQPAPKSPTAANPPRPNVLLLLTSLALLVVWLIFLVAVALSV